MRHVYKGCLIIYIIKKMGNNKESAENVLDIIKKMAEDDNEGLVLSTTVAKVENDPRGAIVGFGVQKSIGNEVLPVLFGVPSRYMAFAFFIDREEYNKYKNIK